MLIASASGFKRQDKDNCCLLSPFLLTNSYKFILLSSLNKNVTFECKMQQGVRKGPKRTGSKFTKLLTQICKIFLNFGP